MSADDGTFRCTGCSTPLNHTDRVCWKCGSDKIEDCRPFGSLGDGSETPKDLGISNLVKEPPPEEEPIILEDSILNAVKKAQVVWTCDDNGLWELFDQRKEPLKSMWPIQRDDDHMNKATAERLKRVVI